MLTDAKPQVTNPMSTPPDSTPLQPARVNFLRVLTLFAAAGTVIATALTFGSFAARAHWRFEQACHFRVQYFWSLLLAAVVLWAAKRPRIAALALIAAVVNFAAIVPIYWPTQSTSQSGAKLRVISFNLFRDNPEHAAVAQFLRKQQADIILLMEVTHEWATAIRELRDDYPHQHLAPRADAFGIALLSRQPWNDIQTLDLAHNDLPTIVAHFQVDDQPFTLVGTHPLPPGSSTLAKERNTQLAAVAKFAHEQSAPTILAGDLNVTDFSPYFHDLLTVSGLRDSRQGRGVQASWGPFPGLEIAIDHCLVSPLVAVRSRRIGPHLGSDHRPVIIDLNLPLHE